jgi:micrococcal nuclease
MYEYKFELKRVVDGDTVDGIIDLGFGVKLHERVRLLGIDAPEPFLQKSIKDASERKSERDRGLKAKRRLREILAHGSKQPEGLYIETFLDKKGKYGRVLGEIKYVYAKDLYNHKEGSKPWVGWQSASKQLLNEKLVELI